MKSKRKIFLSLITITCINIVCRQAYAPPAVVTKNSFLVVEGIISANDSTRITLSRTRNLSDSIITSFPELHARVFVDEENGGSYSFTDHDNGIYSSAPLHLDVTKN